MTETLCLDPTRGFVALPLSVMELELSPGAFRTLAELCRMADRDGWSWPSLAQLADRLGRSRATISAYVAELRGNALVETERQRAVNGYNYRLRYRVTFWADWRRSFGRDPERRVRQGERLQKTNQSQKNQEPVRMTARTDLLEVENAWRIAIGRAPYPAFETCPGTGLTERTKAQVSGNADISADIIPTLRAFCAERGLAGTPPTPSEIEDVEATLSGIPNAAQLMAEALREAWKPHWRRPPSGQFLTAIAGKVAASHPEGAVIRLLRSHLRRWACAQERLR